MRTNAIPSMMDILSKNYNNRNGAVSLYEIGNEYIPVEGELLPDEVPNLVLGMYGDDKDFFTLKGVVENLLDTLAIREYDVDAKSDDPTFHPGTLRSSLQGWRRIWHHRGGSSAGLQQTMASIPASMWANSNSESCLP